MKAHIQRVTHADVTIEQQLKGSIGMGMVILLGIGSEDSEAIIDKLISKILKLRIFSDELHSLNKSITDIHGDVMIISQFTLFADVQKGNRPSFTKAAPPKIAEHLYHSFVIKFKNAFNGNVQTGIFGADMKVALVNDGPVTILLDTNDF